MQAGMIWVLLSFSDLGWYEIGLCYLLLIQGWHDGSLLSFSHLSWYEIGLCYLLLTQAGMMWVSAVLYSPRLV
jgi:hypothetical protein